MNDEKGYFIKGDGKLWPGLPSEGFGPGLKSLAGPDWREVKNPKRPYYPELDRTHPSYVEKHLNQTSPDDNFIEVEKL